MSRILHTVAKTAVWLVFGGVAGGFFATLLLTAFFSLPARWQHWASFSKAEATIAQIEAYRRTHPCYPTHAEIGLRNDDTGNTFYRHGCGWFAVDLSVGFDENYVYHSGCGQWLFGVRATCERE